VIFSAGYLLARCLLDGLMVLALRPGGYAIIEAANNMHAANRGRYLLRVSGSRPQPCSSDTAAASRS